MSEIPKEALEKASKLANDGGWDLLPTLARFIADVSEKAAAAERWALFEESQPSAASALAGLRSLILPDPESDLLKEAREICARDAEEQGCPDVADRYRTGVSDSSMPMRCTLAALKGRK